MQPCKKIGPNRLMTVDGQEYSISGGDDDAAYGTEYMIDEDGELYETEIGAFERFKEKRKERKGNRINRRADRIENRSGERVDNLRERADELDEPRRKNRKDEEAEAVASGQWVAWNEILSVTNPSASAADILDAEELLEVDEFLFKLVDNGSTSTTKILQVWSGRTLLQDFGSGVLCSTFGATSQLQNTQAEFRAVGGKNIRVKYSLAASGVGNMLLAGRAKGAPSSCNR